jgi:itaconyl-CoA hydratase
MTKPTVHDRYAHQTGRLFEDFVVGDIYHHLPGRTISQNDNAWFTLLTMNTHPLHFDEEYAAATEFGRPLVASPLTVAIVVGMSVSDVSATAIANLGWKEIKLFSLVTRFTPTQKYWANANLNRGPMPASSAF